MRSGVWQLGQVERGVLRQKFPFVRSFAAVKGRILIKKLSG